MSFVEGDSARPHHYHQRRDLTKFLGKPLLEEACDVAGLINGIRAFVKTIVVGRLRALRRFTLQICRRFAVWYRRLVEQGKFLRWPGVGRYMPADDYVEPGRLDLDGWILLCQLLGFSMQYSVVKVADADDDNDDGNSLPA
nr:hypothetical protein CFP56_71729 [Quercus suber]